MLPTIIDTPTHRADMPDVDAATRVKPSSVAKAIAFLLSDDAGAITGASIPLSLPAGPRAAEALTAGAGAGIFSGAAAAGAQL